MERDKFLSPEDAKEFGLIDEVVTSRPVPDAAAEAAGGGAKRRGGNRSPPSHPAWSTEDDHDKTAQGLRTAALEPCDRKRQLPIHLALKTG